MEYTDIKTYDDACDALMIDTEPFSLIMVPEDLRKVVEAFKKLVTIVKSLNAGWVPDWMDFTQEKYLLNFTMDSKFEPIYTKLDKSCGSNWEEFPGVPNSTVLVFKNSVIMEYAAETFREVFRDYFIPSK